MTQEQLSHRRRKFLRFPTDGLVWWSKDWELEPIALLDISAGGMLCEFPAAITVGSRVSLHFEFPGHDGFILCNCKVVHSRPDQNAYHLAGLKIVELDGMDQMDFIQTVEKRHAPRHRLLIPHRDRISKPEPGGARSAWQSILRS